MFELHFKEEEFVIQSNEFTGLKCSEDENPWSAILFETYSNKSNANISGSREDLSTVVTHKSTFREGFAGVADDGNPGE